VTAILGLNAYHGDDPRANLGGKVVKTLGRLRNPGYVRDRGRGPGRKTRSFAAGAGELPQIVD
jgi:hypothetical protein